MEREKKRLAEKRCKEEACRIQSCLQGGPREETVSSSTVLFLDPPLLSVANNYKESACLSEVAAFAECCSNLPPDILKYSVHCAGVVHQKK